MPYHSSTMDFTHINYVKKFQTKILIPFIILFHKTLHTYKNLFSLREIVFQISQTLVTKKRGFKTKHHTGRPCESKQPCNL
jgi:hypothetical protein